MSSVVSTSGLARSWYGADFGDFLASDADDILGKLARHAGDGHFADQRDAWLAQIEILRSQLNGLEGWVFFEFNIPRMGRRVDVILVIGWVIFALEFKVGETTYDRAFMKRKKGRPGFTKSEPEFLISYMDRHQDWAVIICLVGACNSADGLPNRIRPRKKYGGCQTRADTTPTRPVRVRSVRSRRQTGESPQSGNARLQNSTPATAWRRLCSTTSAIQTSNRKPFS